MSVKVCTKLPSGSSLRRTSMMLPFGIDAFGDTRSGRGGRLELYGVGRLNRLGDGALIFLELIEAAADS